MLCKVSGGSGNAAILHKNVLVNIGNRPYEANYGYNTVANGSADPIICPAGGYLIRLSRGGPSDFYRYLQSDDFSPIEESMAEYPNHFKSVAIIFNGELATDEVLQGIFKPEDFSDEVSLVRAATAYYRSLSGVKEGYHDHN